ncbi:zinc finger BED domain-containing protein 2 [Sagmatias obliquidens]|uniref:zinc finger BED domain-containing protein 2 n=1 Tax=Sagmatias obliquidens TaxID=3371155 RepID=UPI000F445399|nr:zinc finger BED domain-containing protein 2 [Lagenorhynchus obliquidens]
MRREEEEGEGTRIKAKGDLEVKEEEISETGGLVGPFADTTPTPMPHNKGTWFSEAWEYFLLAPACAGHHPNPYTTCRLCGGQVGRGPGVNVGTTALWKHLKSMHKEELEKGGHGQAGQRQDPRLQGPQLPTGIEGDWARILEQASQRKKEALRRERAVERRERALDEVERAILEMRRTVRAEKKACQRDKDQPTAAHPFHFV